MSRFALRVMRMIWHDRRSSLFIILVLIVQLAFAAFLPLGLMLVIDYAIVPANFTMLVWILTVALVGVAATSVLGVVSDRVYARVVSDRLVILYQSLFRHIQRLSMAFHQRTSNGALLSRYSTDLAAMEAFLIPARQLLLGVMTIAVNAVILLTLQWYLALVVFVGFGLSFLLPNYFSDKAFIESKGYKDSQEGINAFAQENIAGQESIRAMGAENWFAHRFAERLAAFRAIAQKAHFLNYLLDRTAEIGVLIVVILTLCIGSILAYHDIMTIGVLSAFVTILLSMSYLISDVTWLAPQMVQARAGMERIDDLLATEVETHSGDADIDPLTDSITFSDVWFSYTGEGYQLRNANFSITAAQHTLFVGTSGSGKSTIINLLMRFYAPASGSLHWDGVPFASIRPEAFFREVSIVSQDTFLFNMTLRDNIRLGALGAATDSAVETVTRQLGIHDMIMDLPQGYDSVVGAGGVQLSGGQRQRIAIARALIGQPSVLVLDEATSALDATTEESILKSIRALMSGGTVISITHRLTTVRNTDQVFVLDQGAVIEQGRHQELSAAGGAYQTLLDKQRGFVFSDDGQAVTVSGHRLRAIPLLQDIDEAVLEDIANFFLTQHFEPGDTIITEGEKGDTFYLIARGQVDVLKAMPAAEHTTDETVRKASDMTEMKASRKVSTLSDGDFFGEIALLEDVPRTATIQATSPTTVLSLQRRVFNSLLNQAPHLRAQLHKQALRES